MPTADYSSYHQPQGSVSDGSKFDNMIDAFQATVNGLDSSNMAAGFRRTTSTLAGGPPASPADGDIWIATAVDGNGTRWQFQYNAGSASAYKWEFIGGSAVMSPVSSGTTTSVSYADLPSGPSLPFARAGEYMIEVGAFFVSASVLNEIVLMGIGNAGTLLSDIGVVYVQEFVAGADIAMGALSGFAAVTAGYVAKIQAAVNSGNATFNTAFIRATPRRIS